MKTTQLGAMVSGAFVYWDAGVTSQSVIHAKLEAIGLESFTPSCRTNNEALAAALMDYGNSEIAKMPGTPGEKVKRKVIVQPRLSQEENGLELVRVDRKIGPNDYDTICAAKIENGNVVVTDGYAPMWELQQSYDVYKAECTGSSVGQALVELLKHYHATCVRAAGGLYYLPDDVVDDWDLVSQAFETASKSNMIHRVRIVMDENAARTVRAAITQELVKDAGGIMEDLKTLQKDSAIDNRRSRARMLREKARQYESILQDTLLEVNAVLDITDVSLNAIQGVEDAEMLAGVLD